MSDRMQPHAATPRPILRDPHHVLRQTARTITPAELRAPLMQALIDDMFATVAANNLIGMAAPQIGESVRLFVIDFTEDAKRHGPIVMANPRLLHSEGALIWPESSPCREGGPWQVPRAARVKIRGLDRLGTPFTLKAQGLLAVCAQHELDHLDGILCFDRSNEDM